MGGYGTNIRQYAEDSQHGSGDFGDLLLAVRKSTPTALAGAENDYSPLQVNDGGALRSVISDGVDDVLVSVAGRLLVDTGSLGGGSSAIDDAAFAIATDAGTPMMGVVTADSVDAGDVGVVGMDAARNLRVSIEVDNAGIGGAGITDAKLKYATSASIAPLGTATFDSDAIASGKTGHLLKVIVDSTVPWKAELRTLLNGTPSANKAVWFSTSGTQDFLKKMISQAYDGGGGAEGFRVVVTNQDAAKTADVYCTLFWDEV